MARKPKPPPGPRIVTLDIETAPLESYHWGLWDQNVSLEQVQNDWSILAYAAKTLGSKEIVFDYTGGRGVKHVRDDAHLLKGLWKVLDEADIVVTQNGKAFDIPRINARMIMAGFAPYSPIRIIDTKLIAARKFQFLSNRLEYLSKKLTKTKKRDHRKYPGFKLWVECLKDNHDAWMEMRKYNVADVLATEELYLKLRPWTEDHPNVSIYFDGEIACPKCGSEKLKRNGRAFTQTGEYQRYQCLECGGFARSRKVFNRRTSLANT